MINVIVIVRTNVAVHFTIALFFEKITLLTTPTTTPALVVFSTLCAGLIVQATTTTL